MRYIDGVSDDSVKGVTIGNRHSNPSLETSGLKNTSIYFKIKWAKQHKKGETVQHHLTLLTCLLCLYCFCIYYFYRVYSFTYWWIWIIYLWFFTFEKNQYEENKQNFIYWVLLLRYIYKSFNVKVCTYYILYCVLCTLVGNCRNIIPDCDLNIKCYVMFSNLFTHSGKWSGLISTFSMDNREASIAQIVARVLGSYPHPPLNSENNIPGVAKHLLNFESI